MQLVTVLNLCTPLASVLVATENNFGSNSIFTDISRWILMPYDISLIAYGFFQMLGSLYKGKHILLTMACRAGLFLVVCVVREKIYGDVTTNNLPAIRCFVMFAILTCSGQTLRGHAFVIIIFYVAGDCLLSTFFSQIYSFAGNKSYANNKYADGECRALLILVLFLPYILKSIALFCSFQSDCKILHVLKIKDTDAAMKLIDSQEQIQVEDVKHVLKYEVAADITVCTARKILFLATLMQMFCVMTKYDKNIGISLNEIDSLVYVFMQPYINFCAIAKIVETCLTTMYTDSFKIVVKHYKILWKILIYISVVIINAFVFILLVQSLFTFIAEIAEQSVKNFQNVQVNLATTQRNVYGSFLKEENSHRKTFGRSIGEDVAFHCIHNYKCQTNTHRVRMLWTHNDRFLDSSKSDRMNISFILKNSYAESELRVLLIDETDFGEYKCVLVEETDEYIPILYTYLGNGITGSMLFETRVTYRQYQEENYELHRATLTKNVYEVYAGTFVVFEIFAYVTLAEKDDISFQYTINGIDISEICPYDWMSCYPLAFIRKNILSTDPSRISWGQHSGSLFFINIRFCACSKVFGVHKLVIFRDYFNKTSRRTETIEIEHPISFYFLPKDNDTGIKKELFINNTKDFINQYLENNDQIAIPISPGRKLRISVYYFFNFCTVILCFIFIYGVLTTVENIVFLYCKLTIIPICNLLLFGTIRPVLPSLESNTLAGITYSKEKLYDVFISYSDNDYQFAQNVILPYIERGCCKEACFPHRDLAHEIGTKLHLYSKATQQSGKFIVVLSRSYICDPDCNGLQLLACIHPLLTERSGEEKDLLIIKIEKELEVPLQIRLDSRIQVIDWTITNDKHDNLRKIREWLVGYS